MTIRTIRLFHLRATLPEVIGNALVFFDARETLLVELVDEAGVSGWGETWSLPAAAAQIIERQLAPVLLGADPDPIGRLWHRMASKGGGAVGRMAVAALDIALHDLVARRRGVPLATLLGGALRDRVPAYASGPYFKPGGHPYRDFERDAARYIEAGFRAVKLRSGFTPKDDGAIAKTIRRMIGPDAALMVDFNQGYQPRAALAAWERMAEAEPLWIEEPASPGDLAGYTLLSRQVRTALAGGETYTDAQRFLPFLAAGCMDVLQPDIALCGGLTGVARIAALAEAYDRPIIPHVWGSAINLYAALHFAATCPVSRAGGVAPFPYLEFDQGPNPLVDALGRPPLNPDGTVSVPDGPGLGIDPDPKVFAPFVIAHKVIDGAS